MGQLKKNDKLTNAQKCKEYRKRLSKMEYLEKDQNRKHETCKQLKQNEEAYKKHLKKIEQENETAMLNLSFQHLNLCIHLLLCLNLFLGLTTKQH